MAEFNEGGVTKQSNMQRRKEDRENELTELEFTEFPIKLTQNERSNSSKQIHSCDICIAESVFNLSFYMCYLCGVYMCEECANMHKSHKLVKREPEGKERSKKAKNLVLGMRGENKVERSEDLDGESVEVIGRVNVKHELDKDDCYITGLSGLENKRWVAVDYNNYCIKIFCSVSSTMLRYIKFESEPRDVTEIKVKQKGTDPDSVSCSTTDISGSSRDELDKQCLLAITFPDIQQIWIIDVNKTQAVNIKKIKIGKDCFSIDSSEDKIFTLCREYVESRYRYSIDILSTEGDHLKVLQNPGLSTSYTHDLALYKGRVFLTDYDNHKVLCVNMQDGKIIFQLALKKRVGPEGISVDHNTGVLYLCGWRQNKVYKMSPDIRKCTPLPLDIGYTMRTRRLCFINNKLYISHYGLSSLNNVVTVVYVLT